MAANLRDGAKERRGGAKNLQRDGAKERRGDDERAAGDAEPAR